MTLKTLQSLINRRIHIAEGLRNLDLTILQARAEKKLGWRPIFAYGAVQDILPTPHPTANSTPV